MLKLRKQWLANVRANLIEKLDAPQKQKRAEQQRLEKLEEEGRSLINVHSIIHRFPKSHKSPHTK